MSFPSIVECTSANLRVLWALQHLHAHYGSGTVREIGDLLGLSKGPVHTHLMHLVRCGMVEQMMTRNERGQIVTASPGFRPVYTLVAEGARSDR
jgi:DNA-binding MarR family transcriptional regulator